MSMAERCKQRRTHLKLTQAELASRVGITQQSLQKIEEGATKNPRKLLDLAKHLECSPEWLAHGTTQGTRERFLHYVEAIPTKEDVKLYQCPILNYDIIAPWPKTLTLYPHKTQWIATAEPVSEDAFWLPVENDSMRAQSGISISEGDFILVEPHQRAKNGDLVVAKLPDHQHAVFKKLIFDVDNVYLHSLNSEYTQIKVSDTYQIIGVVKLAQRKLS
ncbi:LexA family protein [Marinomonas algarum]|uniref:Helix-turn-helix domain-containing protein n=1 Tax=Marinomonas algarum TaxID=2883105 RepID=A0A9X1ILV0_9GAMM|nr:S24 family peptidase [Marinomonas algarum]MCB5161297.1 helix-turn-helix domain-containing protein [Marinomonas algarum]